MVKAYSAPKANKSLLWIPYLYAVILVALSVVQLMGVGGFDFAHIKYATPGSPVMIMVLAGLEIFSLPFLLRLPLSILARFFSALFAFATPYFLVVWLAYLVSEGATPFDLWQVFGAMLLIPLGIASFLVLKGAHALRFSKK